jgi:hypothetical protein
LISPQLKVLEFVAISHRVSWIRVYQAADMGAARSAAFVTCYAPTEHRSTTEEILQFYAEIVEAVVLAKKATGLKSVPIMCDFNIHLGSGLSDLYPEVVSTFSAGHEASLNARHVMDLSVKFGLVAVQTWRQQQVMMNEKTGGRGVTRDLNAPTSRT